MKDLESFAACLRKADVFRQKSVLSGISRLLDGQGQDRRILNGDDAAAIPDGDGYLLLAAEGILQELISSDPYLAGRSAVLANVNDIYAMGGRPLAMVDVIVTGNEDIAHEVCRGMRDNAERFDVPIVGGHTTLSPGAHCSVSLAIVGRARKLITSFDASPGDSLVMIHQPSGNWLDAYGFWDSSSMKDRAALAGDLSLLPEAAEAQLVTAGKDISMAGVAGTALMLAESSRVGLKINLDAVPFPDGVDPHRWLLAFFSYGFLLAVDPRRLEALAQLFSRRSLPVTEIGVFNTGCEVVLTKGRQKAVLWDWKQTPFTGFQKP